MMKQSKTNHDPRKLKFAEGAIAFVLLLGLTLAVGLGVSSRNDESAPNVAVAESGVETPATVVAPMTDADGAEIVAMAEPVVESVEVVAAPAPLYADDAPAAEIYRDGERAFHERRFDEAVEILDVYVSRRPENAWGWYMLGLSAWKADDDAFAEEALTTALDIDAGHVKSRINLARVLLEQDRAADALPHVEAALTAAPDYVDAYRMLGRVQHMLGDLDAAESAYAEALGLDADDAWSLNNLGLVRIESGAFEAAVAPLARAVSLDAGKAVFQNNLGAALERTGRRDQAAEAYAAALAADPGYAKAGESLARVRSVVGPQEAPFDLAALAAGFGVEELLAEAPADSTEAAPETTVSLAEIDR